MGFERGSRKRQRPLARAVGLFSGRPASAVPHEGVRESGGYKGEKTEHQKNLKTWTEEEWSTQDKGEQARHGNEIARYLSKEAREKLSPEEREATDKKKREGSKEGEQCVENAGVAKDASKEASLPIVGYDHLTVEKAKKKLEGLSDDELTKVRSYGKKHKNRKTLLQVLDRNIGGGS